MKLVTVRLARIQKDQEVTQNRAPCANGTHRHDDALVDENALKLIKTICGEFDDNPIGNLSIADPYKIQSTTEISGSTKQTVHWREVHHEGTAEEPCKKIKRVYIHVIIQREFHRAVPPSDKKHEHHKLACKCKENEPLCEY